MARSINFALHIQLILKRIVNFEKHPGFSGVFFLWMLLLPTINTNAQKNIFDKDGLVICGHRGGFYNDFPENSLQVINYVIDHAKSHQIVLEVDIRQSKDGMLFIMHDETVDRTTNGIGKIAELSALEIKNLRLKNSKGELTEEHVLPLDELLDKLSDKEIGLMLDIKSNLFIETASLVIKRGWTKRSVFLTFKPEHTKLLYQFSDQLIISSLVKEEKDWQLLQQMNIPFNKLVAYVPRDTEQGWIKALIENGFKIMADVSEQTTNNGKLYDSRYYKERITKQQLDIMITDFPVEVTTILKD